ncbi:MAG: WG repeat-containing protein [Prevotella sp.]|nr:WG repeat-containing protein [Prevotella sp.]
MKIFYFLSSKSIYRVALVFSFLGMLFVSCSDNAEQSETEYLPFKSSKDGRWGMMGTNGQVLFEDEFKDEPTSAMNGRFLVMNGNGQWEIYTAESRPEKVGDEYLQIADFTAEVTPAVKRNEKICLIDVNGNVKVTLDKVGNKNIVKCSKFKYSYAIITLEDDLQGVINTNGKVVIEPKYKSIDHLSSGTFVAIEDKQDNTDEVRTLLILDVNGKILSKLKVGDGQKYIDFDASACTSKYLAVCTSVDGERRWGYIDLSNNVIIKPSDKIKYIGYVRGDMFVFNNGENNGVMNFKGEIVLRPKYDVLNWAGDDLLVAYDSENYSLINLKGEKLTTEKYLAILPFYDGSHAAVKISDNSWGFIDKQGKELNMKNSPDIYYITNNSASWEVESDFVDIDAIVSKLSITKNGLMGYNLDMSPLQMVKTYNEITGNGEQLGLTPDDNRGRDNLQTSSTSRGIDISSKVYYNRYLTEYSGDRVVWSKEKPAYMEACVAGSALEKKTDLVYSKISAIVKSFGKVIKENSRAAIVKITEDQGWVLTNDESRITLKLYNDKSYWGVHIDSYAKEGETTKVFEESASESNSYGIEEPVDTMDISEINDTTYSY